MEENDADQHGHPAGLPQPEEQSMISADHAALAHEDEEEDSRTATAGRKKALGHEAMEVDDALTMDISMANAREVESMNFTSSKGREVVVTPVMFEAAAISTGQSSSVFSMLKEDSKQPTGVPSSSVMPTPTTWNIGIQSGLRTSFGSKRKAQHTLPEPEVVNLDSNDSFDDDDQPSDQPRKKSKRKRKEYHDEYDVSDRFIDDSEQKPTATQPEFENADADANIPEWVKRIRKTREDWKKAKKAKNSDLASCPDEDVQQKSLLPPTDADAKVEDDALSVSDDSDEEDLDPQVDLEAADSDDDEETAHIPNGKLTAAIDQELAALGEMPLSPIGIRSISKKERQKMNPIDKAAYNSRSEAFSQAKAKYAEDIKIYEKNLLDMAPRFTEATVRAVAGPSLLARDDKHLEVERTLQSVNTWPLPQEHANAMKLIDAGMTLYPSHGNNNPSPYVKRGVSYDIFQVFTSRGLPIPLNQFSFNIFAPAFLAWNNTTEKWKSLNEGVLRKAFNLYLTWHYSHLASHLPPYRASASAIGVLSLASAKGHVRSDPKAALAPNLDEGSAMEQIGENDTDMTSTQLPSKVDITLLAFTAIEDPVVRASCKASQDRYYPSSVPSDIVRCLNCSELGHMNSSCPALKCDHCDISGEHSTRMCPHGQLCSRCRVRGHSRDSCPEKLGMTRSEITCDLCGSPDHFEDSCQEIWRSFKPKPEEIFQVSGMPMDCYTCGASGHCGAQCRLLNPKQLKEISASWTFANLTKFYNPSSKRLAMAHRIEYSPSPRPMRIKGQGRANDPIELDDSEDEPFIRPSVVTRGGPPPPQMRFAAGGSGAPSRRNRKPRGPQNAQNAPGGPGGGRGGRKAPGGKPYVSRAERRAAAGRR